MIPQLAISYATEGSTDQRFLESIIQHTFEELAFECKGEIEILPIQFIEKVNGSFTEKTKIYAQQADALGMSVLCIHVDADDKTDKKTFDFSITPAFTAVQNAMESDLCKNLVAIVPIQMIEAWLLADKDLLKKEIGTDLSDNELEIHRQPETISDPKEVLEKAISIASQHFVKKRRRNLNLGELYAPIGQKLTLQKLEKLSSFQKFKKAAREALVKLNLLESI